MEFLKMESRVGCAGLADGMASVLAIVRKIIFNTRYKKNSFVQLFEKLHIHFN